ncbi:conserved Plasmodium protein, unknown function [Plasmodium relictum]|uniref:indole-3-glycerol-phosphate synthase n=1 Tax=Plasmodium relictum TaxID=85471 RepID=A0A1J1H726_PLARL|nr:conserved Plasmodium protein, unknown function [Plasmodium relictum]CRH00721.1 conserved Plasmodium protein, unknown function [Plasmodium relictum]
MKQHILLLFIIIIKVRDMTMISIKRNRNVLIKMKLNCDKKRRVNKIYFINRYNELKTRLVVKKKKKYITTYGRDHRNPYLAYEYINKIIENKKYEVSKLMEENCDENNPLQIRMKYLQHTMNNKLSENLRRVSPDEKHRLSLIADIKRKVFCSANRKKGDNNLINGVEEKESQEINFLQNKNYVYQNNFLNLANPGNVSLLLHQIGFDVLIVNTDNLSSEGMLNDLTEVIKSTRTLPRNIRPAVVVDDVIIHPIQIALAVENKADGVILNLSYLKNDLEEMLSYCVNLGTQAIVEVHDYNDIYFATKCGSYIIMINEFDFLNNNYEYNHAIKAINYTIPEIITIAKINVSDINYVEKLGSLGYDSICLEKKLIDDDLENFVNLCKNWNAPHKTLLYLNRNNYLKEFLTYKNSSEEKHKEITENLKKIYDDKNISNKYSENLLKNYEKDFIDVDKEDKDTNEEKNKSKDESIKENVLTKEENKIIKNFKKEKKKEIIFLNQMKNIIKEVDEQCKNYDSYSDLENKKREEKLESLLENFTKLDKNYLKEFFSDEEINNIEVTIKQALMQKKNIQQGNFNFNHKNLSNDTNSTEDNEYEDFDISKLTKEFFDNKNSENNDTIDNSSNDLSDDSSRGLNSQ